MKFGLWVTAHHPADADMTRVFHDLAEQVRLARDLGFSIVTSGQHYLTAPNQRLQTLPLLARLSADAGDMEIGTSVLLLPLHNPVDIAEQVATLDVMTNGRFILGLGLGNVDIEYQAFGVDRRRRAPRFEEALEVMKLLWQGGDVEYHGNHFTVPRTTAMAVTVQKPYPRIWLGGGSEPAIRRAARLGHVWFPGGGTIDALLPQQAIYHAALAEYGNPVPDDFPVSAWVYLSEDQGQAMSEAHRFLGPQYDRDEFERRAQTQFIVGTPEQAVERVRDYRERLGATYMICRLQAAGMAQEQVLRTIRLLGERVLPEVG